MGYSHEVKKFNYMEQEIDKIVQSCSYKGGKEFFDAIDAGIKYNRRFCELLESLVPKDKKIIISGEIAMCFHNFGLRVDIIVPGHLRKGEPMPDLSKFVSIGDEFVFIDDSYFSGRTKNAIAEALKLAGAELSYTIVAYYGGHSQRVDNAIDFMDYQRKLLSSTYGSFPKGYIIGIYHYFKYYDENGNRREM